MMFSYLWELDNYLCLVVFCLVLLYFFFCAMRCIYREAKYQMRLAWTAAKQRFITPKPTLPQE